MHAYCDGNFGCDGSTGDTFALAITFEVDFEGVRAWNVDLAWDTVCYAKALNLVSYRPVTTQVFLNPSPPPFVIQYNLEALARYSPARADKPG